MESAGRFPDSYRRRDIHGRPPLNFRVPPTVVVTEPEEDVAAREEAEREERREQLRRDWAEFVRLRTLAWVFLSPSILVGSPRLRMFSVCVRLERRR